MLSFLSSQNSMNTGYLDTNLTRTLLQWRLCGSCKNLHDCISTLVISGTFFRTDLSTHLAQFHRLQTCLGFLLLLSSLVVVYKIQLSNVLELQQHSPSSREHCLNDVFRDRAKTCRTASEPSLLVELLFLPHRPFNTFYTVPSTSNLSWTLIIVTLVGGVPNSTLHFLITLQ